MSVVSNVHQFVALDTVKSAMAGQRLVRLIAKKDKNDKYQHENLAGSLAVSVPIVSTDAVVDVIDKLIPYVVGMVQDAQDKIIREWRIEHGRNEIPESAFDIGAVIAWLDDNATGDRVTREYLQEWFMEDYASVAREFINSALGGNAGEDVIKGKTNVLRDMFAGFASNKYSPNIPTCKAIVRFVEFAQGSGVSDARLIGYGAKAAEIQKKKESELSVDALGF